LLSAVLATVALDLFTPGPGPLVQPLSAFALTALGRYWLWIVEVAALGVGCVAVTVYQRGAARRFVVTLAVGCVGLAVSGLVATDPWFPWEHAPTPSGWLHIGAVLTTLGALGAGMVLRVHALPERWRVARDRWIERAFGGTSFAALLYLVALRLRGQPLLWFGLWERTLLILMIAWCASLALGPLSAREHAERPMGRAG